jgi:hypothetical protein
VNSVGELNLKLTESSAYSKFIIIKVNICRVISGVGLELRRVLLSDLLYQLVNNIQNDWDLFDFSILGRVLYSGLRIWILQKG